MTTDNLTSREKVDVFNKAMKPLEQHKKQFQSGKFEGTGMKDETITGFTKGAIPQTEAQEKTEAGRKFLKKAFIYTVYAAIPINIYLLFFARHEGIKELQITAVANLFLLSLVVLIDTK